MTTVEGYANKSYYVWLYVAKVCVVTVVLILCRDSWRDVSPTIKVLPSALLVGLTVLAMWVGLDKWISYPHISSRTGVNPFVDIESPVIRYIFIMARFYGLVLMVPLMEEIFWRSFLLRYLTDADFTKLPQGAFSWGAFVWVAIAFGVSHPEWLAALITAGAYALLLRRTKSIFACIIAHLVSNLGLGIYILKTGEWGYW